ncbi:uncharacterized protein LOC107608439 [Arachis ipaensis]|uniref:uncharacterized protein LOC107608439 n=1 Tax=Arachis ipaensis TaxID=130454 RepID=UPI0007AF3005|nr:uncharacterized protein LOC107608439 [Arachis ipaensis]
MANMQIVAAYKNVVEAQYVEMMVPLYSYGCEKKIKKALSALKGNYGIYIFKIIYIFVYYYLFCLLWGICNKYDVLETVRSKRKDARFWNPEDNLELLEDPKSSPSSPITTLHHKDFKRSLTLTKVRSLSLKAWKKVFTRSYSF